MSIVDVQPCYTHNSKILIPDIFVILQGHFPYPDPSRWSDEELGIPPDEED